MKYYIVTFDAEKGENDYAFCYPHPEDKSYIDNEMDRYMVEEGKKVENWGDDLRFVYDVNDGNILSDYLCNVYDWFLVSEKFRILVEPYANNELQYLPVKVINQNTKEVKPSYCVANILNMFEALDFSQSDYFLLDEESKTYSVSRHVLKTDRIQGHHIFRIKEDGFAIFVSQEIKNAVDSAQLLGFDFVEVRVA